MKYVAIAKEDMEALPHTWTAGLDYTWEDKGNYFTIASNEGQTNYSNAVRELVESNFILEKA